LSTVPPGTVLNVAGGSNVSVNDTLAILSDLNGAPLRVEHSGSVKGDVFRTGGDTTKISELLGWKPEVTIEEGLARHLAWGRQTFGNPA
jgi:UDP-glucuronate 4-epimerase